MTKTERKFMVDPKCCERGRVSENFNIMTGTNYQFFYFIIAYNWIVAISKQGQNMTETDIYSSESFIYSNREKFYYKSKISKDEKEKFGCKEQLVEKQYFSISLDIFSKLTFNPLEMIFPYEDFSIKRIKEYNKPDFMR